MGLTVTLQGGLWLARADNVPSGVRAAGVFALLGGILLVVGLRTRFLGFTIGLRIAALLLLSPPLPARNLFDPVLTALFAETISAATVLLGPGAFSLDARLFGRREIIIPPHSRSPLPEK